MRCFASRLEEADLAGVGSVQLAPGLSSVRHRSSQNSGTFLVNVEVFILVVFG